jgi:hypothetical protein
MYYRRIFLEFDHVMWVGVIIANTVVLDGFLVHVVRLKRRWLPIVVHIASLAALRRRICLELTCFLDAFTTLAIVYGFNMKEMNEYGY